MNPATLLGDHLVRLYDNEPELEKDVAAWLEEGDARGDSLLVIAAPGRARLLAERFPDAAVLDAERTLDSVLIDGEPDWERFDDRVGRVLRETMARGARVRAYGEMVDLLWRSGRLRAAGLLEGFWNRLLRLHAFDLYCAYAVDLLDPAADPGELRAMLRDHTHLVPRRGDGSLDRAVRAAMRDVLGPASAEALMPLIANAQVPGTQIPLPEAAVFWLRRNLPAYVDRVLSRARVHYQREDTHA